MVLTCRIVVYALTKIGQKLQSCNYFGGKTSACGHGQTAGRRYRRTARSVCDTGAVYVDAALHAVASVADVQLLYADISCGTVPDGATIVLWLVQGDAVKSLDVTNLSQPLEYPLHEFENGNVHVRLQINGVENTVSEIYIQ